MPDPAISRRIVPTEDGRYLVTDWTGRPEGEPFPTEDDAHAFIDHEEETES